MEDEEEQNDDGEAKTNVQLRDLEKAGHSNNGYDEDVDGEGLDQNENAADQEKEKEDTYL